MPRRLSILIHAALLATLFSLAGPALADPPARVARLGYVSGAVSFSPAGEDVWVAASVNRPLIPGDSLWTESGARDELQIGTVTLRMDAGACLTLSDVDDHFTQVTLSQGRLQIRVRHLGPNERVEVDTPNLALSIGDAGDYRVEVDPGGGTTTVAVRAGQAQAYGTGNAYQIDAGPGYRFSGTDLGDFEYVEAPGTDEFDRWAAMRDARLAASHSARYVSTELVGYQDLDDNGTWRSVPDYGNVWVPAHVARDWTPYRDGHWAWVEPWGWTWVDDAPWGFAVSHYGRWARLRDSWAWVPGPMAERPVFAPALVVFVKILTEQAVQGRAVAWFPLAPREVYRPAYKVSQNYFTNVNISNTAVNKTQVINVYNTRVTNVTNVTYVNRQVSGAVTAVPAAAFVHAQPVARAMLPVPQAALAAGTVTHAIMLAPQPVSVAGTTVVGHRPPPAALSRPIIATTPPPASARTAPAAVNGMRARGAHQRGPAGAPTRRVAPPVTVLAPGRTVGQAGLPLPRPPLRPLPGTGARPEPAPAAQTPRGAALSPHPMAPAGNAHPTHGASAQPGRGPVPPLPAVAPPPAVSTAAPRTASERRGASRELGAVKPPGPSVTASSRPAGRAPLSERPKSPPEHARAGLTPHAAGPAKADRQAPAPAGRALAPVTPVNEGGRAEQPVQHETPARQPMARPVPGANHGEPRPGPEHADRQGAVAPRPVEPQKAAPPHARPERPMPAAPAPHPVPAPRPEPRPESRPEPNPAHEAATSHAGQAPQADAQSETRRAVDAQVADRRKREEQRRRPTDVRD
jgi:hypothetical protein